MDPLYRVVRPFIGLSRVCGAGQSCLRKEISSGICHVMEKRLPVVGFISLANNPLETVFNGRQVRRVNGKTLVPSLNIGWRKLVSCSRLHKQKSPEDWYELVLDDSEAGMTEEEMDRFVTEILSSANKKDIMVHSVNMPQVKDVVDEMLTKGWSPYLIRSVFLASPTLLTKSRRRLSDMIDGPCSFGFTNEQTATLLASGVLADFSYRRFMDTMDGLMKVGMRDGQVQAVVSRFPELLSLNPKAIDIRVAALKELFRKDDIVPLVLKAPRILLDDWSEIADKFNYVFWTMGIKQRQMVRSKLFRYPLHFVKTRHMFLVTEGLYVKPRRDNDPVRQTNPKLKQILDTSDEEFVQKFGDRSLSEYKDFRTKIKQGIFSENVETDSDAETEEF